jgi:hypothetical protein
MRLFVLVLLFFWMLVPGANADSHSPWHFARIGLGLNTHLYPLGIGGNVSFSFTRIRKDQISPSVVNRNAVLSVGVHARHNKAGVLELYCGASTCEYPIWCTCYAYGPNKCSGTVSLLDIGGVFQVAFDGKNVFVGPRLRSGVHIETGKVVRYLYLQNDCLISLASHAKTRISYGVSVGLSLLFLPRNKAAAANSFNRYWG